jgi:predicted aminopeptidase
VLLACAALIAQAGCATVGYLTQAAHGEWQVLHRRQPIARVIDRPDTSPKLRERLEVVRDARQFAISALGLPDNGSYRSYTDLHRPYVTWDVVAAPRFSVKPLRWCFPISGCVSYRGYFHERSARAFAARLAARGNDVAVDGVTAYSTLGHFADPVLSSMLRYDELDLVGTIFHELAHQLIYVPGDSEFDESFAMTVQTEGVARWLAAHGRSSELERYQHDQQLELQVDHVFTDGRRELARLYAEPLPRAVMLVRKQAMLRQIGTRVQALEQREHAHSDYDEWIAHGLNNAYLASVGTYFDCVPGFERLLRQDDGQLPRFYADVRRIAARKSAREELCQRARSGAKSTGGGAGLYKRLPA